MISLSRKKPAVGASPDYAAYGASPPPPECPPGLPSYYLWDSNAALLNYLATADSFSVCDFPMSAEDWSSTSGTLSAHIILHSIPWSVLVVYPFAASGPSPMEIVGANNGWHFAIREKTGSPPGDDADHFPVTQKQIGDAVGLQATDVPLAMFAGLIHEKITATTDWNKSVNQVIDMLKTWWTDAVQGNYVDLVASTIADVQQASAAVADQNRLDLKISKREFLPVTTGAGWTTSVAAIKAAHQNGTSIADALRSLANKGIRTNYFNMLAKLHDENEARALAMVNDPAFASWASTQPNSDPAGLRRDVLLKAGASVASQASKRFPTQPGFRGVSAVKPTSTVRASKAGGLMYKVLFVAGVLLVGVGAALSRKAKS